MLILTAGIVFAVLICAIAVLLLSAPGESMNRTLPGGSVLRLVKISSGYSHRYSLPPVKPWQSFLVRHLPPAFTAGRDWWGEGGSVGIGSDPGKPTLGIFTVCDFVGTNRSSNCVMMTAFGDDGKTSEPAHVAATSSCIGTARDWVLHGWRLEPVPTNSRNLVLKFYSAEALVHPGVAPIAEYRIKNPLYANDTK